MNKIIIERNGEIVNTWRFDMNVNGFKVPLYVEGTYSEVREYIDGEFPYTGRHHAISDGEHDMIKKLKIPVYIAPQL